MFLFSKSSKEEENKNEKKAPFIILIIDANKNKERWTPLFKDQKVLGRELQIEQGGWEDVNLTGYGSQGADRLAACYVDMKHTDAKGSRIKTFKPDILLIRNQVKELGVERDFSNILYGFKFADIPSVNSLSSIYNFKERPWVFGELLAIRKRLGHDVFPLVDQNYYPNHREMIIGPQFPAVVKVGHAHAGYGKMRIRDHHDFADFASIIALNKDYVTAETFYEGEYDLRIQKIGNHYRAYKRTAMGNNWKTNTGTSIIEEIKLTDQYKLWVDECSKLFGGVDILAVDAIHTTDGKEYIMEVNDTSIGLAPDNEIEDMGYIRDLVLKKLESIYK